MKKKKRLMKIKRVLSLILRTIDTNWDLRKNLAIIASYKTIPRIKPNSTTRLNKNTYLGRNCCFNGMIVHGGGKIQIGNNFHSGEGVFVITENHNYKGTEIPYDSSYIVKEIIIEDNVWVGSKVIILGGVRIGEGAIIQAGSVVTKDIPAFSIAGGNPARVFKSRDREHYERLKQAGKFH